MVSVPPFSFLDGFGSDNSKVAESHYDTLAFRNSLAYNQDMRTGSTIARGRPRSAEAHAGILDAAIALTREVGFDALAMDAIAARAGVGKATVYRRWKTKESLIAEALERLVRSTSVPDTGDVERDLIKLVQGNATMHRDPATGMLFSGLVAAMARSPAIANAVRSGFIATRRNAMRQVIARGIARGELARGTDIELALDMLSGPLIYRTLISGASIDARMVNRLVRTVLRGFAPQPPR
jgi:AcrR family transcriptional regulator